eukprot:5375487-Prymnesium_polylepis.1
MHVPRPSPRRAAGRGSGNVHPSVCIAWHFVGLAAGLEAVAGLDARARLLLADVLRMRQRPMQEKNS